MLLHKCFKRKLIIYLLISPKKYGKLKMLGYECELVNH
jgi:hypothetical protein